MAKIQQQLHLAIEESEEKKLIDLENEVEQAQQVLEQKIGDCVNLKDVAILLQKEQDNYKEFKQIIEGLNKFVRNYDHKRALNARDPHKSEYQELYDQLLEAMKKTSQWKVNFVETLAKSTNHVNALIETTNMQKSRIQNAKQRILKQSDTKLKIKETQRMLEGIVQWSEEMDEHLNGIMNEWDSSQKKLHALKLEWERISAYRNDESNELRNSNKLYRQLVPHVNLINQNLTKQTKTSKWRKRFCCAIGGFVGLVLGMFAGAKLGGLIGAGAGGIAGTVAGFGIGGIVGIFAGGSVGAVMGAIGGGLNGMVKGVNDMNILIDKLEKRKEIVALAESTKEATEPLRNVKENADHKVKNEPDSQLNLSISSLKLDENEKSKENVDVDPELQEGKAFAKKQLLLDVSEKLKNNETYFKDFKTRMQSEIQHRIKEIKQCLEEIKALEAGDLDKCRELEIAFKLEPYQNEEWLDRIISSIKKFIEDSIKMKKEIDSLWDTCLNA